jgi:hypothetical protein
MRIMSEHTLTALRLRELLNYEPDTGQFRWLMPAGRYGRIPAGSIAGGIDSNGYILIRVDGRRYGAHRLAWLYVYGEWPSGEIDHIFGVKHDNRINQLRCVSLAVNQQNLRGPRTNNTSGFLGVSWHKGTKRWVAQMWVAGKNRTLGYFSTAEDASAAYLSAKRIHHAGCTI